MPFVTLTQPPVFIQQGEYSARLTRNFLDLVATEGVVGAGDFQVTERAAAPAMQVDVAVGRAFVTGDDIANQFRYVVLAEDVTEVPVDPADLVNPRIDLVVVRVLDSDAGVTGDEARVEVITGTPAGSPVVPATPPTTLPLAHIAVAANAASILDANITDVRTTAGSVFPASIDTLAGVTLTSEADGDVLVYDGSSGQFVNEQPQATTSTVFFLMGT